MTFPDPPIHPTAVNRQPSWTWRGHTDLQVKRAFDRSPRPCQAETQHIVRSRVSRIIEVHVRHDGSRIKGADGLDNAQQMRDGVLHDLTPAPRRPKPHRHPDFLTGPYLPMELNSPLVLGAAIAWFVQRSSKDEALSKARHEKGTLIASGFIAGGALIGVFSALLRFLEDSTGRTIVPDLTKLTGPWLESWHNWMGLGAFLLLSAGLWWDAHRDNVDD